MGCCGGPDQFKERVHSGMKFSKKNNFYHNIALLPFPYISFKRIYFHSDIISSQKNEIGIIGISFLSKFGKMW